jgi:hypothetical protein
MALALKKSHNLVILISDQSSSNNYSFVPSASYTSHCLMISRLIE